jgi:hypothetical protein
MKTTILLSIMALAAPLFAHHPFSEEFDVRQTLTLSGRIQSVTWSEPHAMITMNVASDPNRGDWKLQAASPATLNGRSFTQAMLKQGDAITVEAYRAKNNTMLASVRAVKLADGRWYSLADPSEDGGPAPTMTTTTSSNGAPNNDVLAANRANGELPQTASYTPWFAVAGVLSLIFAATLSRWRAGEA